MTPKGLISNEFRTSSISILAIEVEMNEELGCGYDPMLLLIRLEDEHGEIRDEDIAILFSTF